MATQTETGVAARLLEYLRRVRQSPQLEYATTPEPLAGGFETSIFSFTLSDASGEWSGPLVLRLFRAGTSPLVARLESSAQSVARSHGYPAPDVLHLCESSDVLGAPFTIMPRLAGTTMFEALFPRGLRKLVPALAELHARLHRIPVGDAARETVTLLREHATYGARLEECAVRVGRAGLEHLREGIAWLQSNAPRGNSETLCHGDFHPKNILMADGAVTGVIDWSLVTVAPREFDVGNTVMLVGYAPTDIGGPVEPFAAWWQRRVLAPRYVRAYRKHTEVDLNAVRYYEAYRCMRGLIWAAESRAGAAPPGPWDAPAIVRRLERRFVTLTRVPVSAN